MRLTDQMFFLYKNNLHDPLQNLLNIQKCLTVKDQENNYLKVHRAIMFNLSVRQDN